AFSTSSFTTEAGRSITSPAAICPCTAGGRTAILPTWLLEDEARVLACQPGLHLGAVRLEAGAPHEPVGEPLPLLDPGLPERVDAGQRAHGDGRRLEEEEEHLVGRPLHVELELRVLVGGAERAHRRLPPLDGAAGQVPRLAEALRPELAEPVGGRRQALAVWHEDQDRLRVPRREQEERA